ncbi:MAG: nucleoside recognition protein [Clostridiales bacterium]|jgi:spore maturation protein A|nr:nucleoside recognition protein [Clostridiales bacterium]
MLNVIWILLLVSGIVISIITGKIDTIGTALINSANDAVKFSISIAGIMALWCGLMSIANDAGIVDILAKICRPVIRILCPETKKSPEAEKQVITNITANFLGLGNGATPSGIKAVKELQDAGGGGETATVGVCMFLVLNSTALQLIPTTVIALRAAAGSTNAMDIMLPTWIATFISSIVAILTYFLLNLRNGGKTNSTIEQKEK